MTAGLASGVYDRTSPPLAKTGSGKKGREELSVVRINEETNPPPMTKRKFPEVSFVFSLLYRPDPSLLQSKLPPCNLLSLKVISLISYLHLVIFKAQTARMLLLLQSKSPFTRTTSWLPSPILLGYLCHLCNRCPANRGHPTTPSTSLNHQVRKGRDRGAQLMNSQLRRNQNRMTSRQAARLTLRETTPAPLLRSLLLSHQSLLRPKDSEDYVDPDVQLVPIHRVLAISMLPTTLYSLYLCSTTVLWVITMHMIFRAFPWPAFTEQSTT